MNWLSNIKRNWYKRSLTRPEFSNMFENASVDANERPNEWVAIDCEMTGLDPHKNHILSVAAIHINGNAIDSGKGLDIICKPPIMPTAETIVIHGLRPQDVEQGMSYESMLDILLPFIGNRPIVGFCPQIDMAFINPLTKQYIGTKLPNEVIDIRKMYNRKTGNRTEGIKHQGQSLTEILKVFNIPQMGSHDAYNDTLMTAMAFMHLK